MYDMIHHIIVPRILWIHGITKLMKSWLYDISVLQISTFIKIWNHDIMSYLVWHPALHPHKHCLFLGWLWLPCCCFDATMPCWTLFCSAMWDFAAWLLVTQSYFCSASHLGLLLQKMVMSSIHYFYSCTSPCQGLIQQAQPEHMGSPTPAAQEAWKGSEARHSTASAFGRPCTCTRPLSCSD